MLHELTELAVVAVATDELVVGAGVDELAVTHNKNVVGVADGGESVSDNDAGAVCS